MPTSHDLGDKAEPMQRCKIGKCAYNSEWDHV
jgi:hypothetical protein